MNKSRLRFLMVRIRNRTKKWIKFDKTRKIALSFQARH